MGLTRPPATLWHFTCDHSVRGIAAEGALLPNLHPLMPEPLVWLTDLDCPPPGALGLDDPVLTTCDRLAVRVEVAPPPTVVRWVRYARAMPSELRRVVETKPGVLPAHWWVSTEPVPLSPSPSTSPAWLSPSGSPQP